jgi:hypothetical protein
MHVVGSETSVFEVCLPLFIYAQVYIRRYLLVKADEHDLGTYSNLEPSTWVWKPMGCFGNCSSRCVWQESEYGVYRTNVLPSVLFSSICVI